MEATWVSIDRWIDKEIVVTVHNGILLNHKKEHIWVSSNEVDEHRAYYKSEVSQKEKYCILTHIYKIHKNGAEEFTYRAAMEKQT